MTQNALNLATKSNLIQSTSFKQKKKKKRDLLC